MPYYPDFSKLQITRDDDIDKKLLEWKEKKQKVSYQQALEEEARRKAAEWLEQRPFWQKTVDVVLPGEQFRTPPLPEVEPQHAPEVPKRSIGERVLRGIDIAAQSLMKAATFGLGGAGGPIDRAISKLFGVEPLTPPEPETTFERITEKAGTLAGSIVSAPAMIKAATTIAKPIVSNVAEAVSALPKPLKVGTAIGAGITAEEITRGAVVPGAKEQNILARFGASLRTGLGDVISATGEVAQWLKNEQIGQKLKEIGQEIREGFEEQPKEFNWKSFFDPDWYAINVARALPLTLPLIPAMYVGYKTGGKLGAKLGLGPFGRAVLSSLTGAAVARPLEAAFEAGNVYEEYLRKNPDDIEGAEKAANEVFLKNLALLGLDAGELASAFAPTPIRPVSRISKAAIGATRAGLSAAQEAIEEGLQEKFQREALGEPVRFDEKMKEAMAIGGLFGAAFGGIGTLVEHIKERTLEKLPPDVRQQVSTAIQESLATGAKPEEAVENGLNAIMENDEQAKQVIEQAVKETINEIDQTISAVTETVQQEKKAKRRVTKKAKAKDSVMETPAPAPASETTVDSAEATQPAASTSFIKENANTLRSILDEHNPVLREKVMDLLAEGMTAKQVVDYLTEQEKAFFAVYGNTGVPDIDAESGIRLFRIAYNIPSPGGFSMSGGGTTEYTEEDRQKFIQWAEERKAQKAKKEIESAVSAATKKAESPVTTEATPEILTERVSPEVGGIYRVKVTANIGKLKAGQEFTGKVNRIFRAKSGATLAELETLEGQKVNIPVSNYAEWHEVPTVVVDETGKQPVTTTQKAQEEKESAVVVTSEAQKPRQMTKKERYETAPEVVTEETTEKAEEVTVPKMEEVTTQVRTIEYKPGDRVTWKDVDRTYTGTVRSVLSDDRLEIEADEYKTVGGVPVRHIAVISSDNPTLQKIETHTETKPIQEEQRPNLLIIRPTPLDEVITHLEASGTTHFEPLFGTNLRVYRPSLREKGRYEYADIEVVAPGLLQGGTFISGEKLPQKAKPVNEFAQYVNEISRRLEELSDTWAKGDEGLRIEIMQRAGFADDTALKASKLEWSVLIPGIRQELVEKYADIRDIISKGGGEKSVPVPGREQRGIKGTAGIRKVEKGDEDVLGEVAPEVERRTEETEEVRGDTGQTRAGRAETVQPGVPRPNRETRSEERTEHPGESGKDEGGELHGGRVSEDNVAVSAARTRNRVERARNYVITDPEKLEEGGIVTKARRNLEALKLLKKLEEEGRTATPEEQDILAGYTGWGAAWQVFEPWRHSEKSLRDIYRELKDVLTPQEFAAAQRSTQYAHYTAPVVVRAMWKMAEHLGFKGGKVLEPALGTGYFFGLMPPKLSKKSKLVGVEIEPIAGKIAQHLYPEAKVYVQGFEQTTLPDNFFDLAISNVPFGDIPVPDPSYPKYLTSRLHNYFFVKALDKVRPGGLIMFISSTGLMDAKGNTEVRRYLADKADLVAAIRLPGQTHKKVAQTEVTTDIIILRKRAAGEARSGESWIESKESGLLGRDGKPLYVNEYYINHPEMVIGNLVEDKLHPGRVGVDGTGFNVERVLNKLVDKLPQDIMGMGIEEPKVEEPPPDLVEGKPALIEGSIIVRNDRVYKVEEGKLIEVTGKQAGKLKGLVAIRDAALEVLGVQYRGGSDEELKVAQEKLNKLYDAFVKNHGYINNNIDAFISDPYAYLVGSLETNIEYSKGKGKKTVTKAVKADIFTKRTIRGTVQQVKAETSMDALLASLAEKGKVDLSRMAQLVGKTEKEILRDLEGRIFKNPETGEWETAEQYLSGNVRTKLKVAMAAAELDPAYRANVEALEKVQPDDLSPSEIRVAFGAPWIRPEYIGDFIASLLNIPEDKVLVNRNVLGKWEVNVSYPYHRSAANTNVYGTYKNPAHKLIELALNKDLPVEKVQVDGKWVVDPGKTELARQKQRELERKFAEWLWSDPKRAEELTRKYNELYNAIRLPEYDGSHLTFPGLNTTIKPWPHQRNAVWRILTSPTGVLIGHGVGKGKTLTITMAAMELRRLGIAKKPMIVVPKSLKEQWERAFKEFYPGAKILVLGTENLPGLFSEKIKAGETEEEFKQRKEKHLKKRKEVLMRIATGDWDAIIITGTAFQRLPVSRELEEKYINAELELLKKYHGQLKKEKGDNKTIKKIEADIQKLEAKLKLLLEERAPDRMVMSFEELGVDWLFVDEAHYYKKLPIVTKMDRVGGVPKGSSQRALDMYIKTEYIRSINNGRGVVFATGTPITNTMAELYVLKRYLAPEILRQTNTEFFDDWASVFTSIGSVYDYNSITGKFEAKHKLQRYINLADLVQLYHSFSDIVLNRPDDPNVPRLRGGKRVHIAIEPTQAQIKLFEWCNQRLEAVKNGEVSPEEDNALKIQVDANKISLDPRLIDPSLPDEPNTKINKAVEKIYEVWERTKGNRSTQLVFLDISVPKRTDELKAEGTETEEEEETPIEEAKENIVLYNEIKRKLVSLGVPENEIAFIHECKTDVQKKKLSEDFNEGRIRILIGSTGKMGVGLNLQKKLIALHHIDCPWRPDEIEQREGRILRPGNENKEVEIYVYGTMRSLDLQRWNQVVYKANFVSQAMEKGTTAREVEAPDDVVLLSLEEARAAFSGNPLLEEKVKVDADVSRLIALRNAYLNDIKQKKRTIDDYELKIEFYQKNIKEMEEDLKQRNDTSGNKFSITIKGKTYTERSEANAVLLDISNNIPYPKYEVETKEEVGSFAGFKLYIGKTKSGSFWRLEGAHRYSGIVEKDIIRSMEGKLRSIEKDIARYKQEVELYKKEIEQLREEINKPFPEEERLNELLARQRQINIQLGLGEGLVADIIEREEIDTDDNGMYPLPELEKLRAKADPALAGRVKGAPKLDVYYLPKYAPQKTSIKQVARGLRLGVEKGIYKKGMVVADVGGGLYDDGTKYLAQHGINNLVYDPYARTKEHNDAVLRTLYERGGADAVALNNVLNVIPRAEDREAVLKFSYGLLKSGGYMIVTVYEGNRSGKGSMKEFKKDGTYTWQENRKLDDYEGEIRKALPNAIIEKKYNAYIIRKPHQEKEYEFYALAKPKQPAKAVGLLSTAISPGAARKIEEKLTEVLNTVVTATRTTGPLKGARAVYLTKQHAVRTKRKYLSHWRTVGHELGHAFLVHTGYKPDPTEMVNVVSETYPGGLSQVKDPVHEGFAEFLVLYLADNARAKKLAPKTYDSFERFVQTTPRLKQAIDGARAIAEEDLIGTPLERMRRYTTARTETPTAIGGYKVPWWKRPTFALLDGSIPLRSLYEEAVKKGYTGLDPAKLYAVSGMAWDKAVKVFESGVVYQRGGRITPGKRSLANILKDIESIPNGLVLFNDIAKALRYKERAEKGFEIPMPKEEVDAAVEQAERDYPEIVKLVREYCDVLSDTCLQVLVDGGVISTEVADRVKKGSDWYVPLYVKRPKKPVKQEPLRSSGPGVVRYRGHVNETLPIIEATLMKLQDVIQAVEINRLMQAIEESLKHPNMGNYGLIVEKPVVAKKLRLKTILEQISDFLDEEIEVDDPKRIVTLFMPGFEGDLRRTEPIVVARHGDKETYMQLAPDLFEAVQSLRPITYNMVVKVLSAIGSYGRLGALTNIRYVTNNIARDIMSSAIQSKTTFERSMLLGYLKGALTAAGFGEKAGEIMNLYIQSGAYGSAPQEVLRSMMRSAYSDGLLSTPIPGWKRTTTGLFVRIINTPLDVLRIQEEAPRVAEFVAVLEKELKTRNLTIDDVLQGNVPEDMQREVEKALLEAAYASREVIVNFGLHGVSQGWRTYVRCVPFLHGSLQGIYRSYRMLRDKPGDTLKRWLVYVLPITLLAWVISHRDDRYRDMPSEARDRYWWFPVGNGIYYAVAKPYEYALPANMLERLLDWVADSKDPNRRKPLEELSKAVWNAVGIDLMPMVVSTIWDIARNRDAFGAPIEPMREQNVPPEYRYGPSTTKAARMLAMIAARIMGDKAPSPKQIDYFMRGIFGGFGTTFMRLIGGELHVRKEAGIERTPIIGPLLYGPVESGSRIIERFYRDYEQAQKLYNAYRLHGRALSEHEARLVQAIPAMRTIANELATLRRELRNIEMSDKYTLEQKRIADLLYKWVARTYTGYLYGQPVPAAPPELGITEAYVQDTLRYIEQKIELSVERAKKKAGGPL